MRGTRVISGGSSQGSTGFRGLVAPLQATTIAATGTAHAMKIGTPIFITTDVSITVGQPSAIVNTNGLYRVDAMTFCTSPTIEAVRYRMSDLSDELAELFFEDSNSGAAGRFVFLKAMTYCVFDVDTSNNDFAVSVFNDGTLDQDFSGYLVIEYKGAAS